MVPSALMPVMGLTGGNTGAGRTAWHSMEGGVMRCGGLCVLVRDNRLSLLQPDAKHTTPRQHAQPHAWVRLTRVGDAPLSVVEAEAV